MYKPRSVWTWSFVIIEVVQAAVIIALECDAFAIFEKGVMATNPVSTSPTFPYTRAVPVGLALYVFAMFYALILTWDALRMRNTIQIIGLCLSNLALIIYGASQIKQINDSTNNLKIDLVIPDIWEQMKPSLISIPCILALGTILLSFVAYKLYQEFAWTIYKHISADLRMKRRFLTYQIYITLLKFDFFFALGFTIQFIVVVVKIYDSEFWITVAAIPLTIIILLLAAYWTRKENRFGMFIILILYFASLAYFIFKLVRIWTGEKVPDYKPVANPLTTFAAITILLIVGTIINCIQCMMNFNKGLKPYLNNGKSDEEEKGYITEMPNISHGQVPSRMTID